MKHQIALQVAEGLVDHLRPACERIEIKGSVSRLKPEVNDIEIMAIPDLTPVKRAMLEFGKPVPRLYKTALDKVLDEMQNDGAISMMMDGPRFKKLYLEYAGIKVDLFLNIAPSEWGVQSVIRTGPEDFSHWVVTNQKYRGALPDGYFVKHQVVWIGSEIKKHEIPENADKAIAFLTETNHVSMPEELDFLNFLNLGWIEPKDRIGEWGHRLASSSNPTATKH